MPKSSLDSVRKNLDHYVNTDLSSFSAYPNQDGVRDNLGTENGAWLSDQPLGSVVQIDIPGNPGVVMVTDVAEDHWTFSTVQTPDDRHPVSGNRQFGYTEHGDGSVTFYTRGVDRITNPLSEVANDVSKIFYGPRGVAFTKADQLWRSFQQGLVREIRDQGGRATVGETISVQPRWAEYERALVGDGAAAPVIRGRRR